MTSYTITCPPTAATESYSSSDSYSRSGFGYSEFSSEEIDSSASLTQTLTILAGSFVTRDTIFNSFSRSYDNEHNSFITSYFSNSYTDNRFQYIIGQFNDSASVSSQFLETFLWNGEYTRLETNTTGGTGSTSRNLGTATRSIHTTTTRTSISSITETATFSTGIQSAYVSNDQIFASSPSTTILGGKNTTLQTSALTTTTFAETITRYGGQSGTRHTATIVHIGQNEAAYLITQRPDFSTFAEDAASLVTSSVFTAYPSWNFYHGYTANSTETNSSASGTNSLSLITTSAITTAVTAALLNDMAKAWPPVTRTIAATTLTTISTQSVWITYDFTAGETTELSVITTQTHNTQMGEVSWNGTHTKSTTIKSSNDEQVFGSYTSSETYGITEESNAFYGETAGTRSESGAWQRSEYLGALPVTLFNQNAAAASSLLSACAHPSNVTEAGLLLSAGALSIDGEWSYTYAARTAVVPAGTTDYLSAGKTFTANADGAGVTVSDGSGTTSAAWELNGAAVSTMRSDLAHRANIMGAAATGLKSVIINAGVWRTADDDGIFSTQELSAPITFATEKQTVASVYLPAVIVTYAEGAAARYFTTERNRQNVSVPFLVS